MADGRWAQVRVVDAGRMAGTDDLDATCTHLVLDPEASATKGYSLRALALALAAIAIAIAIARGSEQEQEQEQEQWLVVGGRAALGVCRSE